MDLSGKVKIPGIGEIPKSYVAVGASMAAAIVAYMWWSRSQGGESEPAEGDYYADLRTGSAGKDDGYTNPGGIDTDDGDGGGSGAPKTNSEWAARVQEKLTWYEPSYVSRVIGAYLDRQEITQEESTVVREAWAQVGQPPEGSIPIRIKGSGDPSNPPATTPAKPPAPRLHHVYATGRTSLMLQWTNASGAAKYRVYRTEPGKGTVTAGETAADYFEIKGLKPGTSYSTSVASISSSGTRSASTSNIVRQTTKK